MSRLPTFVMIAIAGSLLVGCTDPRAATKALDDLGFTEIQTTGYAPFYCAGKEYSFSTGFTAKNPRGKTVRGAVCSGLLTGSSVKFE